MYRLCRFFPTAVYLSTSKLAVAAVGNLSFAMALCMYNLVIKVHAALHSCCICRCEPTFQHGPHYLLAQMAPILAQQLLCANSAAHHVQQWHLARPYVIGSLMHAFLLFPSISYSRRMGEA